MDRLRILGAKGVEISEEQDAIHKEIESLEKQALDLKHRLTELDHKMVDALNEQYKDLIGKPVVIKFNWKTVEYCGLESNEWRGIFLGFVILQYSTMIQPVVRYYKKKNGNQFDRYPARRIHNAYNIASIGPDLDHDE